MKQTLLKRKLEQCYLDYTKPEFVDPDPLMFLYEYETLPDREIVALLASSLAYGRVQQILKSIRTALEKMDHSPARFVQNASVADMNSIFADFKHRFTTGEDLVNLFLGVRKAWRKHGSLEETFLSHYSPNDETILSALSGFSREICCFFPGCESYLLPSPEKGSACKRANLMLRWLVRKDAVDPGSWERVPKRKLLIPLDTHMFRIAKELGLCSRTSANLASAVEITNAFAEFAPEDPVKYDFALTRFGIHPVINRKPLNWKDSK